MKYSLITECDVTQTTKICPSCGAVLQKITTNSISDNIVYWICNICDFVGVSNNKDVNLLYTILGFNNSVLIDFTIDKNRGYAPLNVTFTDNCIGITPSSWVWDFGDSSSYITNTDASFIHTYTTAGLYSVTMQIQTGHDTTSIVKDNIILVNEYEPCIANFNVDKLIGPAPLTIKFEDISTGSEIIGWEWNFGDNTISSLQNPTHIFDDPGEYTIELVIHNSRYQENSIVMTNLINVTLPLPIPLFNVNKTSGCVPLSAQFTSISTGIITEYLWDFGDGHTSVEQNPIHIYESIGTYNVSLTVTNESGSNTKSYTSLITVSQYFTPSVDFVYNISNLNVTFMPDVSACDPTYYWSYGDGNYSTESIEHSHTYDSTGIYNVSLAVVDSHDTTSNIMKQIII